MNTINEEIVIALLKYIREKNLCNKYDIIPFSSERDIDDKVARDILSKYDVVEDFIDEVLKEFGGIRSHIYLSKKAVPHSLNGMGHILVPNENTLKYFFGRNEELKKCLLLEINA